MNVEIHYPTGHQDSSLPSIYSSTPDVCNACNTWATIKYLCAGLDAFDTHKPSARYCTYRTAITLPMPRSQLRPLVCLCLRWRWSTDHSSFGHMADRPSTKHHLYTIATAIDWPTIFTLEVTKSKTQPFLTTVVEEDLKPLNCLAQPRRKQLTENPSEEFSEHRYSRV